MSWPDIYLLSFAVGVLWTLAALLLGGFHVGHSGSPSMHNHLTHGHSVEDLGWIASMINPSCAAIFLAWFGGIGYLLARHSGLDFWIDLAMALAAGLIGAWLLAAFLRVLKSHEQPMDAADYEMVGVLGHVASTIRADGVGEIIYVRDGARKSVPARSDEGNEIARGEEVIVTRYEKGIAYVRTWDAMTQRPAEVPRPESLQKETEHVE
jgi:membrane protein implicated in regulation of membrane protease activity